MSRVRIEVAYACADVQAVAQVELEEGSTVAQAIAVSGFTRRFPEIDVERTAVGIYGTRVTLETVLNDGDRVEIYRPLKADPKEARRRRAKPKPRL